MRWLSARWQPAGGDCIFVSTGQCERCDPTRCDAAVAQPLPGVAVRSLCCRRYSVLTCHLSPRSQLEVNGTSSEPVPALIQAHARERVARHWPVVRAFECRTVRCCGAQGLLEHGEWVVFTTEDGFTKAGIVQQVAAGHYNRTTGRRPSSPQFAVFERVPGANYFVNWSGSEEVQVRADALPMAW